MCRAVKPVNNRGGEFANILKLRANNFCGVDVFKHYRNLCYRCDPVSFHDFAAERLHYNINICRNKRVIYIRNWMESILAPLVSDQMGIFLIKILKQSILMPL